MLAVLKKRWKPKRAGGGPVNNNNNARKTVKSLIIEPTVPLDSPGEKIRVSTSPRQIHPVGEKVMMAPAPNICVQGGRIEFISPNSPNLKDKLELRIAELESLLEEEKKTTLKERRNTARFQALVEDQESLARDVEIERTAREEAEARLLEFSHQAERTNSRLASLQETINRLEDSLRAMAAYKTKYCQLKAENAALTKTIEGRVQHFQSTLSKLSDENEALKAQLHTLEAAGTQEEALSERLRMATEENSRLLNERQQCEKCLDQVAHQVVQALLSQKGLREEISSLREKVKELEKQNYTLSSLLLQQRPKMPLSKKSASNSLEVCVRPLSCDEGKLKWRGDPLFWLPIHRPCSLNLDSQRLLFNGGILVSGGECHKDEGYSTMSSEVQCENGANMSQSPLERLQEESTSRFGEEELVVGLRVPKHVIMTRSASDSALLSYSTAVEEQEWWDLDSTLSRIDFDAPPELEEWNMDEIPGLSFLTEDLEDIWFSVLDGQYGLTSPGGDSWSSHTTTSEESKRSSGTESESVPAVGTHFTRDFYRLVKFESTKSLASTSSRSQMSECGGRDALQSVLQFIAEQQQYLEEPAVEKAVNDSAQNNDSGVSSNLSSTEEVIKTSESRGLLTVPEEIEEEVTTLLQESPLAQVNTLAELHKMVDEDADEESPSANKNKELVFQENETRPTGWVLLDRPSDLADPKMRANLLDVMMSSRSSSSCSCSSESGDDHSPYQHLHRLHRSRRHKKASATRDGALRVHLTPRVSIVGREDIFTRFGVKEQEAVACFDFLEEINTSSRESTTSRPKSQ